MSASLTVRRFNESAHKFETVSVALNVGDGVSYAIGGDAYPMTVRKISPSGKTVWCSQDNFLASQGENSYEVADKKGEFIPRDDPSEGWRKFTKRSDGKFRPVGDKYGYLFAGRCYHQDPHF